MLNKNIRKFSKLPQALVSLVQYKKGEGFLQETVDFKEYCYGKNVVLVGYPGAFTPTCMSQHLPGYIGLAETMKKKGADEILALSVNDPFVVIAFAEYLGSKHLINFLADGNGELTQALDLGMNLQSVQMGQIRTQRFSMIIKRERIIHKNLEGGAQMTDVSSAETLLN